MACGENPAMAVALLLPTSMTDAADEPPLSRLPSSFSAPVMGRPPGGISVGRWVIFTVVALHLAFFAVAVAALLIVASHSESKFAGLALKDFRSYLLWTNVDLLRGYAVISLGYILLAYPVVRFWFGEKAPLGRWPVIWRTLAVCAALMGYFWLRLVHSRPYFLTADNYDHWYFRLFTDLPEAMQARLFFVLFDFLPAVVWLAAAGYYGTLLLRKIRPVWPSAKTAGVSYASVGLLAGAWLAAPHFKDDAPIARKRHDGPPNILILGSDSLRADRLSCNGYPRQTTPNIDKLAAQSVNFTRMMTPIASTLESMTTLMTSQYPHTHGIQHMYPAKDAVRRAAKETPKLPEILGRHGYKSAVMGDWCAGIFNVMPLGFQQVQASAFDDFKLYMAQAVYMAHFIIPAYFDNDLGYWMFPRLQSFASYVTPEVVTERLTERLEREAQSSSPFFIKAFYSCTHLPYYCPPPYHKTFADRSYNGKNKYRMDFNVDAFIRGKGIEEEFKKLPPHEVRQIRDLYDGSVRFFDDQVGQVLESLKRNGLGENTIVIVMSDHGDDLCEPNTTFSHGLSFNGGDQTNHLPFIVHVPNGSYEAGKINKLARTIDIAPTLLDMLGLPPEPQFEGASLMPYMERKADDLSLAFFGETGYLFYNRQVPGEEPLGMAPLEQTTWINPGFGFHFEVLPEYEDDVLRTKERCLRTEHWKLVFTPGKDYDIWRLFDLRTDPHCQRDVKLQNPAVWQAMEIALRRWVDERKESRISEIFPEGEPPAVILPGV